MTKEQKPNEVQDELREEYDFAAMGPGVRGKYYERAAQGKEVPGSSGRGLDASQEITQAARRDSASSKRASARRNPMGNHIVEYEGRSYLWNVKRWFDRKTYSVPPAKTIAFLDQQLQSVLAGEDESITNPQLLLKRAMRARDAGQLTRAEKLVKKVLERAPDLIGAVAVYTSVLRLRHRPQEALEVSHRYRDESYPPLLVSRAAALCDLARWEEAKKELARALAIGATGEAFAVSRRIKAARPELYSG